MTWLKLDDGWCTRPEILALSDGAYRLHTSAMSHCMRHLTDRSVARHVVSMLSPTHRPALVAELVRAGLWVATDDGWTIADQVMDEQPSSDEVRAERDATNARVALSRAMKAGRPAAELAAARALVEETRERARLAKAARPTSRGTPLVTPPVTPAVTVYVTPPVTVPRPDPTRPGATTSLSGSGSVADLTAGVPFRDLVPEPEAFRSNGHRRRPVAVEP